MSSSSPSTDLEFVLGVLFIPLLLLLGVGLLYVPDAWVPRCWLLTSAGLPCPACGSFRALQLMARGELVAAFHQQPFAILAGVGAIAYSLYAFLAVFGRIRPVRLSRLQKRLAIAAVLLLMVADWLYVLFRHIMM